MIDPLYDLVLAADRRAYGFMGLPGCRTSMASQGRPVKEGGFGGKTGRNPADQGDLRLHKFDSNPYSDDRRRPGEASPGPDAIRHGGA